MLAVKIGCEALECTMSFCPAWEPWNKPIDCNGKSYNILGLRFEIDNYHKLCSILLKRAL